jgi:glycine cleavage system H protein
MFYTDSHEWISLNGKRGRVGITQYARTELGEIVFVELPKVGTRIQAGEEISVLESTKAASDVYAPVSGVVVAVHEALGQSLESLNQDPESKGWLFEIELSNPKEIDRLLSPEEYRALRG